MGQFCSKRKVKVDEHTPETIAPSHEDAPDIPGSAEARMQLRVVLGETHFSLLSEIMSGMEPVQAYWNVHRYLYHWI
jgi:hypothetical protein